MTASIDSRRTRSQTPALAPVGVLRVAALAALSVASLDTSLAQAVGDPENCSECAQAQPGTAGQAPESRSRTLSIDDDLRRRLNLLNTQPEGRSFRIANNSGLDLAAVGGEEAFLEAYDYVVSRTGATLERPISLQINQRDAGYCPPRGVAQWSPSAPGIQLFLTESSDRTEALGILAHEIGHIVQALGLSSGMAADGGFDQGFASWAAGRYWTDMLGFGSFAEAIASYRAAGTYLPLDTTPDGVFPVAEEVPPSASAAAASAACLAKRDIWYTVWAAFIDHLVERFGAERLLALLSTSEAAAPTGGRPGGLDYATVYGATLETLEADWLETIDSRELENDSAAGEAVQ